MTTCEEAVLNAVKEVIQRRGDRSAVPVTREARLAEDLALQSLELAEVVIQLEEVLAQELPIYDRGPVQRIADLVALVEEVSRGTESAR